MSIIPSGYFIWTEQYQCVIITLCLLFVLDTFTGVAKAIGKKELSSNVASLKISKKVFLYGGALMMGYLLSIGFSDTMFLNESFVFLAGYYSLIEAYSILENLSEMGLNVPQKIIKNLKQNIDNYGK